MNKNDKSFTSANEPSTLDEDSFNKMEELLKTKIDNLLPKGIIITSLSPPEGLWKKECKNGIYFLIRKSEWNKVSHEFISSSPSLFVTIGGIPVYESDELAYDIIFHGHFRTDKERLEEKIKPFSNYYHLDGS